MYKLIVARNLNGGIGFENSIPWNNKKDLYIFQMRTINNIVIMGYNTYLSLNQRILKGRLNIVITHRTIPESTNLLTFSSIFDCDKYLNTNQYKNTTRWVIGGESIYNQYMKLGLISELYISEIYNTNKTDKGFYYFMNDKIETDFVLSTTECYDNEGFKIYHYKAINPEEITLINHMKNIITSGFYKHNRTGINTYSLYGNMFHYMITEKLGPNGESMYKLPLLTTKKMFIRGIFEELKWFLNGGVNSKELEEKQVNIWKGNTTKEYLNKYNLTDYKEGECGPIYGFQWKHWGADYIPGKFDYTNEGIDQIANVIKSLQDDPFSRRHIISGWNVSDLNKMCLPPCFLKDTMVLTNNGYKFIQNVNESDALYTHKSNYKDIINVQTKTYSGKIYHIKTKLNDVIINATEEHPFLVKTKIMTSLEPREYKLSDLKWIEAKDLNLEKHVLCIPINQSSSELTVKVKVNDNMVYNQSYLDENGYYMLGYYIGVEGSILHMGINPPSWSLLKEFDSNTDLASKIPKWVFDLNVKYIHSFLNGFLSTKRTNDLGFITVKNYEIALSLQLLFGKIGKIINILIIDNQYVIRISSNSEYNFNSIDNKYIYTEIETINTSIINNTTVYNFEIGTDNSYTVENIAVHNCHVLYQFLVHNEGHDKYLTLMMTQRSCDTFLGLPFNIASLGLFLILMAKQVNMKPYKIIHSIADMHIYENHIDAVNKQIEREPYPFPYVIIKNKKDKIEDYEFTDLELYNYHYHDSIKAEMIA